MLTRQKFPPVQLSGDWEIDGPRVVRWMTESLSGLNRKQALSIDEATITARYGIKFPATQIAQSDVNTLDDYEEGSWTPALTFATPGNLSLGAYTVQLASYTKIGRIVTWAFAVTVVPTQTTAAGALQITGLPFAASSDANYEGEGFCSWGGITKATYTQINPRVVASASLVDFVASGSGVARSSVVAADVPSAGTVALRAGGIYRI